MQRRNAFLALAALAWLPGFLRFQAYAQTFNGQGGEGREPSPGTLGRPRIALPRHAVKRHA